MLRGFFKCLVFKKLGYFKILRREVGGIEALFTKKGDVILFGTGPHLCSSLIL